MDLWAHQAYLGHSWPNKPVSYCVACLFRGVLGRVGLGGEERQPHSGLTIEVSEELVCLFPVEEMVHPGPFAGTANLSGQCACSFSYWDATYMH